MSEQTERLRAIVLRRTDLDKFRGTDFADPEYRDGASIMMAEAADTIDRLTRELAEAREKALEEGFLRGFMSSAEGYNGEYHFDLDDDCLSDTKWVEMRNRVLSALKEKP